MAEPGFDPAAWAGRWIVLGGEIDSDALRWPFPIWLTWERRSDLRDEMAAMLLALTPEQGEALRTWALLMEANDDAPAH